MLFESIGVWVVNPHWLMRNDYITPVKTATAASEDVRGKYEYYIERNQKKTSECFKSNASALVRI